MRRVSRRDSMPKAGCKSTPVGFPTLWPLQLLCCLFPNTLPHEKIEVGHEGQACALNPACTRSTNRDLQRVSLTWVMGYPLPITQLAGLLLIDFFLAHRGPRESELVWSPLLMVPSCSKPAVVKPGECVFVRACVYVCARVHFDIKRY